MAFLSINDYNFRYSQAEAQALQNINLSINKGEFVVMCGESGSGKTTLLKMIKHDIAPYGVHSGTITFRDEIIEDQSHLERSQSMGYVFQQPKAQVVMGTVMDELVFGMENIGMEPSTMKKRMAEVVQFLGISNLLHEEIETLSGGQVQLVNLASILMLYPELLLLDEPTSQLDPIAKNQFIQTLRRLNKEQAMTIIISEHNLEELISIADRMVLLEKGRVRYNDHPQNVIAQMKADQFTPTYLPLATQFYLSKAPSNSKEQIPLNVKETKDWLNNHEVTVKTSDRLKYQNHKPAILTLKNVDYQYSRKEPLIINRLSAEFFEGDIHAILGGNGSGKTTLLKLMANILKPQAGQIKVDGKKTKDIDMETVSYLPQDPQLFFIEDTIIDEYKQIADNYTIEETRISEILADLSLENLAERHPYDLSGGQLQKAAIGGALLTSPKILLLDEPTKGLDPEAKDTLGRLLKELSKSGQTIILVSHDVEFVAKWADRCSLFFNGAFATTETTDTFFTNNYYYTTVLNRISRDLVDPPAVTLDKAVELWDVH